LEEFVSRSNTAAEIRGFSPAARHPAARIPRGCHRGRPLQESVGSMQAQAPLIPLQREVQNRVPRSAVAANLWKRPVRVWRTAVGRALAVLDARWQVPLCRLTMTQRSLATGGFAHRRRWRLRRRRGIPVRWGIILLCRGHARETRKDYSNQDRAHMSTPRAGPSRRSKLRYRIKVPLPPTARTPGRQAATAA
jgi:hypothetical protein